MTQAATLLCAAPHCAIRRRHRPPCQACICGEPGRCKATEHCDGCQPRRAADGLYLCEVCTRRLVQDARTAAVLYEDLGQTLIHHRASYERRGHGDGAPVPDGEVMDARTAIRATMVSLVRLVADERGFAYPHDGLPAMAAFLARSNRWLAADRAAAEHAKDLRDVASDPRAWRLAYPSGSDRLYLGDCPRERDGTTCAARLYQAANEAEVTCAGCGYTDTVEWWQRAIVGEAKGHIDAYAIAAYLSMQWCRPVDPGQIRLWAHRGRISRYGADEGRRTLYDVEECCNYAARIWGELLDRGLKHSHDQTALSVSR